ncbi:aromatic amino acid aminotransferase [Ilyonectria sp. MPI-CAGE-AT-0026]|nr:aromatic amino acid aminotransferase [Ilyonectria sp. MPI-CAGE-AT-0026]
MSHETPKPIDLAHHFSNSSKKRVPNVLKEYYKFLRIPEMGNLAGGLPFPANFPFNSLNLSLVDSGSLFNPHGSDSESGSSSALDISIQRRSQGTNSVRKVDLDTALQYSGSQGYPALYAWLKKLANTVYHPNIPYNGGADVMINGGSADGLWKVYELLFNHWDKDLNKIQDREGLIVEEFVYGPPIAQIKPRDVNIVPVKMDAEGMLAYGTGGLQDVLQNWDYTRGKRPHVVYIIPHRLTRTSTGQNPTSGVLSFPRRKEIYQICSQFDLVLIEDDPYWNLYYPSAQSISLKYRRNPISKSFPTSPNHNYSTQSLGGKSTGYQFLDELVPSFLSIDTDGRVIRLDSFSKTIAPGCRLGWITAQPSVCEQLFRITDSTTQPPSGFVQAIVSKLLGDFGSADQKGVNRSGQSTLWGIKGWIQWLEGLRVTNERRMITMATILEENRFLTSEGGQTEMFSFQWPMGGMFLWVRVNIFNHPLASSINPKRLMLALWISCTQHPYRILTVPGQDFAANEAVKEDGGFVFLRFCFAAVEESLLEAKSRSFVEACRDFWAIRDAEAVEYILREEDGDDAEVDREVIEDWEEAA